MRFGKNISIVIAENEIIDSERLKKIIDEEISVSGTPFYLWNKEASNSLVEYMSKNNYFIIPGEYEINQVWGFEEGLFIIKGLDENGKTKIEKREILKFEVQQN